MPLPGQAEVLEEPSRGCPDAIREGRLMSGNGTGPDGLRCSVVIRAYNEERHIARLLEGILRQTVGEFEILLVDSGSTDATLAIASRYPVRIIKIPPAEFSFGRSLNLGCSQAMADLIVIASAHVFPVYPDWLERLLAPFDEPQVGLSYGRQIGTSSSRYSERQQLAKMFPSESVDRQDHPLCNNANAAIRRELWTRRPYDETLSGLEDLEWATWLMQQGFAISYVAEAEVVHVHRESAPQLYNRYRREAMALRRIQPWQSFHSWDFVRLFISNSLSDGWHALREGERLGVLRDILVFRLIQFWGTYRGFHHTGPVTRKLMEAFYYPRGFRTSQSPRVGDVKAIDYSSLADDRPPRQRIEG
jgi:glycosyltransferase involved in cell wall biosynthesis